MISATVETNAWAQCLNENAVRQDGPTSHEEDLTQYVREWTHAYGFVNNDSPEQTIQRAIAMQEPPATVDVYTPSLTAIAAVKAMQSTAIRAFKSAHPYQNDLDAYYQGDPLATRIYAIDIDVWAMWTERAKSWETINS